ncbi:hypothetical protein [Sporomusa acidovorans]|uniref:Nicotinate phosphoribosyltransferase n=1 Tax=Sporomusa acidovorans (strain ATCC 49682 / DSM 3132 / Mol) TaxID=1123286 RepID=A0ABZ3J6H7_SPOA4|nr:hypothetical protein [Sporomusa acidovorans]OZC24299.1 nicotinate phosphoribosyltransferase [Sporomusa acidovorans DSM 3132]SDF02636.1 nicotinate phosphoribosyltransferase [Sporomusa acidovorans]
MLSGKGSYRTYNREEIKERTDKYFSKTFNVINMFGSKEVTYGVFLRRDCICAIEPALTFLDRNVPSVTIQRLHEEGAMVRSEEVLFTYTAPFEELVEIETLLLRNVGFPCLSAYNAYHMCLSLPKVPFMDMHPRHSTGDDMSYLAAYGAGVGSKLAKLHGCKGFIGTSQDLTAEMYGTKQGVGTIPHALVGYAGSTVEATKMFMEANPEDYNIVALVDYYGKEITDSLAVAEWFYSQNFSPKTLGVRLDTHGGRFAEGLDFNKSVEIICNWLHVDSEYQAVRAVIGEDTFDLTDDITKDRVRKILFGTGVSAANIINTRNKLDQAGYKQVSIVVSSGFDLLKCKIMAKAKTPINVVGTGSFLPLTLSETYATADVFKYDGEFSVKLGREKLFKNL